MARKMDLIDKAFREILLGANSIHRIVFVCLTSISCVYVIFALLGALVLLINPRHLYSRGTELANVYRKGLLFLSLSALCIACVLALMVGLLF